MSTTPAPTAPRYALAWGARSMAKVHVIDLRYSSLMRAVCGATVQLNRRPEALTNGEACKRCQEESGHFGSPGGDTQPL